MRQLLILLPLSLTGCASVKSRLPSIFKPTPVPTAVPTPKVPPVYRTPDGLKITPMESPYDENAQILSIRKWHFKVTMPPLATGLKKRLEWIQPGKAPQQFVLSEGSLGNERSFDLVVAIQPIEDSISRGDKLRVFVGNKWSGTTEVVDNPMEQYRREVPDNGYSTGYHQDFQKDGSCVLLEMGGQSPHPRNPKLILRLKAVKGEGDFNTKFDKF
jgi:hypothetical protein